jgi:antitoxin ChpS
VAIISRLRKQGGAAVMTIRPASLKLMDLDVGAQVTLSVEQGKLVAEPAAPGRKRYSLAELLKGSAGKKLNSAAAWAEDGGPLVASSPDGSQRRSAGDVYWIGGRRRSLP